MDQKLKLKKNDFGLRVTCSKCNVTYNQSGIKKCKHFDKQKYKVIIYQSGGTTRVKTLTTRDYNKAIQEAVAFKTQVKSGVFTVISKKEKIVINEYNLSLLQAADGFVKQKNGIVEYTFLKKDELTEEYVSSIVTYIGEFIKVLADNKYSVNKICLSDIEEEHIEAWLLFVKNKYDNPSTINARIRAMRGFLNHVNKRYNFRLKNHFKEIELLDELKGIRSITKIEFEKVCEAVNCKTPYYYYKTKAGKQRRKSRYRDYLIDAFKLGLYTGLRREELFSLKWSDVKRQENGKLLIVVQNLKVERITKKEFRPKYILLHQDLHDFLISLELETKLGNDEFIIVPNRSVTMNTLKDCISRAFKHYFALAFPEEGEILPFKSLRKTYLTYLSKYVGDDAIYLSSHSSISTLEKHYLDPKILARGEKMKLFE